MKAGDSVKYKKKKPSEFNIVSYSSVRCPVCHGTKEDNTGKRCPKCRGTGQIVSIKEYD